MAASLQKSIEYYWCRITLADCTQSKFAPDAVQARGVVIDLSDLLRADPEARWASWLRARQSGVLSPNDVRAEEDWPASTDPSADLISPPNTSAAAVADSPPASDKVVDIGRHRDAAD
jgi:hypothetical protein